MENRAYKRTHVSLAGELCSDDILYAVFITDVSERGLCSIISTFNVPADLIPNAKFNLKIQLNSKETINLSCEERWSKIINNGSIKRIGWEINNPPAQYSDLLKTL